jgi:hypothetical protein
LGWNPDAETTITANEEPVGDVLDRLVHPMDLTYRAVNAHCVQITSPDRLASHLDVEFYPAADLMSGQLTGEALLARLRAELGEEILDATSGVLHFDQPSGYLIAALPQPLQRQLATILETRRSRS